MKKILFYLGFLLLGVGCQEKGVSDMSVVLVDFGKKSEVVDGSKIISTIALIPLKSKGKLTAVSKILASDSLFYVLDKNQEQIFCFSKRGDFRHSISKKGKGHGEYFSLDDFLLDDEDVIVLDSDGNKILRYDKQGNFLSSISSPSGSFVTELHNTYFVHSNNMNKEENLYEVDKLGNIVRVNAYPGVSSIMSFSNGGSISIRNDSLLYLTNTFDYSIYKRKSNGELTKEVTFDFADRSIGEDILKEGNYPLLHEKITQTFDKVLYINIVGIYKDLFFVTTDENRAFIYNAQKGEITYLDNLSSPYNILLYPPFFVRPDGTILGTVSNENLKQLAKSGALNKEQGTIQYQDADLDFLDDYWIVEGKLAM